MEISRLSILLNIDEDSASFASNVENSSTSFVENAWINGYMWRKGKTYPQ